MTKLEPNDPGGQLMMLDGNQTYQAFLLRLWRSEVRQPWHASLIPVDAQEQAVHFASVEHLAAFLQTVA